MSYIFDSKGAKKFKVDFSKAQIERMVLMGNYYDISFDSPSFLDALLEEYPSDKYRFKFCVYLEGMGQPERVALTTFVINKSSGNTRVLQDYALILSDKDYELLFCAFNLTAPATKWMDVEDYKWLLIQDELELYFGDLIDDFKDTESKLRALLKKNEKRFFEGNLLSINSDKFVNYMHGVIERGIEESLAD